MFVKLPSLKVFRGVGTVSVKSGKVTFQYTVAAIFLELTYLQSKAI